ncbi:MAG: hypothetical protein JO021_02705 [Alphaproteobacteria bacterium]|nr:hypothetical protein [Alphaproteobacteria bacterium]
MELEFTADASPADVADCVYRNGLALVRGHYERTLIAAIADTARRRYVAEDILVAQGKLEPNRYRTIAIGEIAIDGRPAAEHLVTDLARFVAGVCLETTAPAVQQSYVRRADLDDPNLQLPFHQDSRILGVPLVNLWIPLSDCGRAIPGLEVVTQRIDGLISTLPHGSPGTLYADHGIEIDAATVLAGYPDSLWHPEFAAGDVLVFRGTTVHRTYVTPGMSGGRMSIDLRLVVP